jgi:hypothetical protein
MSVDIECAEKPFGDSKKPEENHEALNFDRSLLKS